MKSFLPVWKKVYTICLLFFTILHDSQSILYLSSILSATFHSLFCLYFIPYYIQRTNLSILRNSIKLFCMGRNRVENKGTFPICWHFAIRPFTSFTIWKESGFCSYGEQDEGMEHQFQSLSKRWFETLRKTHQEKK